MKSVFESFGYPIRIRLSDELKWLVSTTVRLDVWDGVLETHPAFDFKLSIYQEAYEIR